jgi:hypothetical protein
VVGALGCKVFVPRIILPEFKGAQRYNLYKKGNHPIVMVDQLWMWVIGNGELLSSTPGSVTLTLIDTLITCFPQSYAEHLSPHEVSKGDIKESKQTPVTVSILDIIEHDLEKYDARSPMSIGNLACLIINSCAGFLDRYRDPPIIRILDIFDETINEAVSHLSSGLPVSIILMNIVE